MDPDVLPLPRCRLSRTVALVAMLAAPPHTAAEAHQAPSGWSYPFECCAGRDCAEISSHAVRETADGYAITLGAGEHPMVREPFVTVVPYADARISPDGAYHICLSPALKVLCFFAGARGV